MRQMSLWESKSSLCLLLTLQSFITLQIQVWIREAGMDAWVDAVGNVHGRLNGSNPSLPTLFLGSHYDTVLDAGRSAMCAGSTCFAFCYNPYNLSLFAGMTGPWA